MNIIGPIYELSEGKISHQKWRYGNKGRNKRHINDKIKEGKTEF